jgi:hypothetical protein
MITCGQDHAHDREQQQLFEQELQAIIDRAYDTHHVCELVTALQKGLAGVIATDIIDTGGSKERMQAIAADVARYMIQVYEQLQESMRTTPSAQPPIESRTSKQRRTFRSYAQSGCAPSYLERTRRNSAACCKSPDWHA